MMRTLALLTASFAALTLSACLHRFHHHHPPGPPPVIVHLPPGHVHHDECGHHFHGGQWYHAKGHRHGHGCGHVKRGAVWVID